MNKKGEGNVRIMEKLDEADDKHANRPAAAGETLLCRYRPTNPGTSRHVGIRKNMAWSNVSILLPSFRQRSLNNGNKEGERKR
ncbi:hypothetical protein PspKH34_15710 [Parageobacillus sp. KH3-4]|nr:hypothetical protein PspKH34_15710 [Parageobacillus sp. KH3-4]